MPVHYSLPNYSLPIYSITRLCQCTFPLQSTRFQSLFLLKKRQSWQSSDDFGLIREMYKVGASSPALPQVMADAFAIRLRNCCQQLLKKERSSTVCVDARYSRSPVCIIQMWRVHYSPTLQSSHQRRAEITNHKLGISSQARALSVITSVQILLKTKQFFSFIKLQIF